MKRIEQTFERLAAVREKALIVFLTAGDPDLPTTWALVRAAAAAGADVVELGIPFSDPLADGPTIQKASERALAGGVQLVHVLDLIENHRHEVEIPIILMGYYNPILSSGTDSFVKRAARIGVDGLIVPDLPADEGEAFYSSLREAGVAPILMLAPTSTSERIRLAAGAGAGFLYYVSLTGVTGARERLATSIPEKIGEIRRHTDLPIAVGFGISRPEHVAALAPHVDGVVVGSALVEKVEQSAGEKCGKAVIQQAASFIAALKQPTRPE